MLFDYSRPDEGFLQQANGGIEEQGERSQQDQADEDARGIEQPSPLYQQEAEAGGGGYQLADDRTVMDRVRPSLIPPSSALAARGNST
jgi:hypothetical protein